MDAVIWTKTSDELPPEGEVVRTLGEHGTEQDLKRSGAMWFVPDGSMYVYYSPIMWHR